jgi:SAM-dependent methyltransferase
VAENLDPVAYNRAAWDREVERGNEWTQPVGPDVIAPARAAAIRTVLRDMRALGAFPDGSFDVIVNPVSNVFCPHLAAVWRECFRVLRPAGALLREYGDGPIEYSHTLTTQIGGQLAAGFSLTHRAVAPHHGDATARYLPGYIATRATPTATINSAHYRSATPTEDR